MKDIWTHSTFWRRSLLSLCVYDQGSRRPLSTITFNSPDIIVTCTSSVLALSPPSSSESYLSKEVGNYQCPSCASDLIHEALLTMWIAVHELLESQQKNSSSLISIEMASLLCRLGIIYKKGFSAENRGPAGNALLFIHKEIQLQNDLRNWTFKSVRWTSPGPTTKAPLRCRAQAENQGHFLPVWRFVTTQ